MRFLALLKKELRECLPWAVAAAAILLIFGSLILWPDPEYKPEYRYYTFERYSEVSSYSIVHYPIGDVGGLVFVSAIGLGLALGVRQFWVTDFMGTWGFTLHRSTSRTTILAAKICAGFVSLIVAVGLVWCYLFWRANLPDCLLIPPSKQHLIEGWLIVGIGFMFYLGVGLVGVSKARWYTTKVMGLGFALWMFVTLTQQQLWWGFVTLAIAVFILLCLAWGTFLKRQF